MNSVITFIYENILGIIFYGLMVLMPEEIKILQKLYGEPKMTFDKKRSVIRCGQAVIKNSPKKKYSKKISLSSV